jgi:hypothetical protein
MADPLDYTATKGAAGTTATTAAPSAPQSYDPLDYTTHPENSGRDATQSSPARAVPPPSITGTSWSSIGGNERGESVPYGGVSTFLRALDEGAGFDTTAVANTPPPPRADNPWATAIGQDLAKAAGVVGGMAKGLSFGLAPRLDRTIATPGQELNALPQAKFEASNPDLQTGSEIVGSLPTAAIGEGALARVIPPSLGTSVLHRALDVLGQGARGGIVGGTAGAGMNEDDPLSGAAGGAVVGAGIPSIMGLAKLLGQPAVDAVAARLVPSAADAQARAKIAQAFTRDMVTPTQAQTTLATLGPEGALIDTGPPKGNVIGLGSGVANQPGNARGIATQFLEGRMEGAPTRINAAINAATGNPANFHATMNNLADLRSTNAAPLYEQAFSKPAGMTDNLQGMLDDPVAQQGLKQGLEIQRIENAARVGRGQAPLATTDPAIQYDDNGDPRIVGVPNMRSLDAVKRGMDAMIEDARSDVTGQVAWTPRLRAIDDLRRTWVSALDQNNPDYAAARAAWAGPSEARDAMEMGRNILNNDPEVTADTVAGLSDGNKDFFRAGVARALKDKVDATQEGADATRKIFGNTLIRNKIAAGFGDDATFNQFRSTMENEGTYAQTRNAVLSGSRTAPLGADIKDVDYSAPVMLAAAGHPVAAAGKLIASQGGATPLDTNPVRTAIAKLLFSGGQSSDFFNALGNVQNRQLTPWARVPAGITGAIQAAQPPPRRQQGLLGQ